MYTKERAKYISYKMYILERNENVKSQPNKKCILFHVLIIWFYSWVKSTVVYVNVLVIINSSFLVYIYKYV